jgi:hypothetical protein
LFEELKGGAGFAGNVARTSGINGGENNKAKANDEVRYNKRGHNANG